MTAVLPWPLVARAQQPERVRRIDVLMAYAESDPEGQALRAFLWDSCSGATDSCGLPV